MDERSSTWEEDRQNLAIVSPHWKQVTEQVEPAVGWSTSMQEGRTQPWHALPPSQVTDQNTWRTLWGEEWKLSVNAQGALGTWRYCSGAVVWSIMRIFEKFELLLGDKRQKNIQNRVLFFMGKILIIFFLKAIISLFPSCVNFAISLGLFLLKLY